MAKEKKKSKIGSHLASISFFTLMGMVLGFAMISFLEWQLPEGIEPSEKASRICRTGHYFYQRIQNDNYDGLVSRIHFQILVLS